MGSVIIIINSSLSLDSFNVFRGVCARVDFKRFVFNVFYNLCVN